MNNFEIFSYDIDTLKEFSNELGTIADDCDTDFNAIRKLISPLLKNEDMEIYYKSILSGYFSDLAIYIMFFSNSVRNLGDALKYTIDSYSSARNNFVTDLDALLKKMKLDEK